MKPRDRFLKDQYRWMLRAVDSKNHPDYDKFGRLGVTIDEAWRASYERFLQDVEPTLPRGLSRRQMLLKPRCRRFDIDSIEWGFDTKLYGLRPRLDASA